LRVCCIHHHTPVTTARLSPIADSRIRPRLRGRIGLGASAAEGAGARARFLAIASGDK